MKDVNTLRRRQWLRRLAHGGKNAKGIDLEELSWYLSERLALVICAVIVFAVIQEYFL